MNFALAIGLVLGMSPAHSEGAEASAQASNSRSGAGAALLGTLQATFPALRGRLETRPELETESREPGLSPGHAPRKMRRPGDGTTEREAPPIVLSFPLHATGAFVVEGEGVRVAVRPRGAAGAPAEAVGGKVAYVGLYEDTDALHVVNDEWTEEYLFLHTRNAPRRFEYEIVETRGVRSIRLDNGQVHFMDDAGKGLVVLSPVVVDAAGRRSATAAWWESEEEPDRGVHGLTLHLDPSGLDFPLVVDPSWITTGSLNTARGDGIGILLQDDKVLIMGNTPSAEVYDVATGIWSPTGPGWPGRAFGTAVLLRDGRVLAMGGYFAGLFDECFLYDPITDAWSPAASMGAPRQNFTATVLRDGRVLVTGGDSTSSAILASAELYDPATNTWTPTGSLTQPKARHTATLLDDGRVMVTGGVEAGSIVTGITEVYDAGVWTRVGDLGTNRVRHSATLLRSGRVLVAGGAFESTAELFDPGPGTWSPAPSLPADRAEHSATLLPNGRVIVAGSVGNSTLLYTPGSGWSPGPNMTFTRFRHASTMLPDGRVLVAGGFNGPAIATAELLDIDAPAWSPVVGPTSARRVSSATLLRDGRVLVVGAPFDNTAEVFNPAVPDWTPTNNLTHPRWEHTATLLNDGRVLVAGTSPTAGGGDTAELYNPGSNDWTLTGSMAGNRYDHAAVLLPCGEVLVAAGSSSAGVYVVTAERYNPGTGTWRSAGDLNSPRDRVTATLLRDGRVLLVGGWNGGRRTDAEIYDPLTDTWSPTGSMFYARYQHTATLLPSGKVLIVGGGDSLRPAELFDPASGTFSVTGTPGFRRSDGHSATLLPNGRVLVVGGFISPTTAEVYDPVTGLWTAMPTPVDARDDHVAMLLLGGRVLVAGGQTLASQTTAELFDVGRGELPAWRPTIVTATSPLVVGSPLTLTGTDFQGIGEGSTGLGYMHSATNYPLVQLQRLDNEAVEWLFVDPAVGWSDTGFGSWPVPRPHPGPTRATVFTNGIPSVSRILGLECPPPVVTADPADASICVGGAASFSVAATGECASYQWRKNGIAIADGGPYSGTRTDTLNVGGATLTEAGSYDAVVVLPCSGTAAQSAAATLTVVADPPLSGVSASLVGSGNVCTTCIGGTASEIHAGGGAVTYQWGYRTMSLGTITDVPGQTGASYVVNGADFPGPGSYFLVVTTTPASGCGGGPQTSNEIPIMVTVTVPGDDVLYFTVTSRHQENVLEWVYPGGILDVRIRYTMGPSCIPPTEPFGSGMLLVDQTGTVPGQKDRYAHGPLTNGVTYCYTIFAGVSPIFSAGRSNTGRPMDTSGDVKWAFSTGVLSLTAPTVGSAGIIATSNDNVVHAIQRDTVGGEWPLPWMPVPVDGAIQSRSPIIPITVGGVNPVAFLGTLGGSVYAVDAVNGGPPAPFPWLPASISTQVMAAPAGMFTAFNGSFNYLLVGTRQTDNEFVALNPMTGAVLDTFNNGGLGNEIGVIDGMASVDYSGDRVYFTSHAHPTGSPDTLWCLNLLGPAPPAFSHRWSRPLGDIFSSPVVRGDRVYVGGPLVGGTVYGINRDTGGPGDDRTFNHGNGQVKGFVFPDRASLDLYFATDDYVWGVTDTGAALMTDKFGGGITLGSGVVPTSAVLFVPGSHYLYVGGSDGRLYEIDTLGPSLKSVQLGDGLAAVGSPSLDRTYDLVIVGTEAGKFYAVHVPFQP